MNTLLDNLISIEELAPIVLNRFDEQLRSKDEWMVSDLSELNLTTEDFERVIFLIQKKSPIPQIKDIIESYSLIRPDDVKKIISEIRKQLISSIIIPNDVLLALLTENERYKIIAKFSPEMLLQTFVFDNQSSVDHKDFVKSLKFIPNEYELQSVLIRYAEVKNLETYDSEKIVRNVQIIISDYYSKLSLNEIFTVVQKIFETTQIEFIGFDLLNSFVSLQLNTEIKKRFLILENDLTSKWIHKDQVLALFEKKEIKSELLPESVCESTQANQGEVSDQKPETISEQLKIIPNKRDIVPIFTLNTDTKKIELPNQVPSKNLPIEENLTTAERKEEPVPLFIHLQQQAKKEEDKKRLEAEESNTPKQAEMFESINLSEENEEAPYQLHQPNEPEITFDANKKEEPNHGYPPLEKMITQHQAKQFVKYLFNKDEKRFVLIIKDLNDIADWEEAKKYIELIFSEFKVDLYSREAIQFTDIVYGRYHHL